MQGEVGSRKQAGGSHLPSGGSRSSRTLKPSPYSRHIIDTDVIKTGCVQKQFSSYRPARESTCSFSEACRAEGSPRGQRSGRLGGSRTPRWPSTARVNCMRKRQDAPLKRAADDQETAREGRPALNSRGTRTKSTVSARNPEIEGSWPHQPQAPLLALPWGPGRSGEVWRPGAGRARSRFPSPWCFSCRFQILRNERYSFTITEKRSTIQFFHL